jgi:hypothetical protein
LWQPLQWSLSHYDSTKSTIQTKSCTSHISLFTHRNVSNNSPITSFDEVHFGKFAAYYITREYYFDVHPPFAKLLFGLAGWFVGFDGKFHFENIGDSYTEHHVPFVGMRALPAILGSLTIPLIYAIMKESGYSTVIAAFSASLVLFGALLQLRFPDEWTFNLGESRQCAHCSITAYSSGRDADLLHCTHHLFIYLFPQTALSVHPFRYSVWFCVDQRIGNLPLNGGFGLSLRASSWLARGVQKSMAFLPSSLLELLSSLTCGMCLISRKVTRWCAFTHFCTRRV